MHLINLAAMVLVGKTVKEERKGEKGTTKYTKESIRPWMASGSF